MMHREVLAGGKNCESVIELVLEWSTERKVSCYGMRPLSR